MSQYLLFVLLGGHLLVSGCANYYEYSLQLSGATGSPQTKNGEKPTAAQVDSALAETAKEFGLTRIPREMVEAGRGPAIVYCTVHKNLENRGGSNHEGSEQIGAMWFDGKTERAVVMTRTKNDPHVMALLAALQKRLECLMEGSNIPIVCVPYSASMLGP